MAKLYSDRTAAQDAGALLSRAEPAPFVVRLPGFVTETPVGLGDAVRRVTAPLGFRACGGCERRAAAMNRWIVFAGQRSG